MQNLIKMFVGTPGQISPVLLGKQIVFCWLERCLCFDFLLYVADHANSVHDCDNFSTGC